MDLDTVRPDPTVQVAMLSTGEEEASKVYENTYSYDEVFPALPESESNPQPNNLGMWNQKMKLSSTVITQVFRVPVEERRYTEMEQFGSQGEQAKKCAEIMQQTDTHIEISSAKDQSLTILVSGKLRAVLEARRRVVEELQTPACINISIPKEHHRFILGKNGNKLRELELNTATRISVPKQDSTSDVLKIEGSREGIDRARHEIQVVSDEQSKLASERISIPKIYHPFIVGPHSENVNQLMQETGVRINIPPPSANSEEISIAGEKEGVHKAKQEILRIYEEKKRKCQQVSVEVKKSQHRYVIGSRGTTIQEILAQTGVSVEMPSLESTSETITLRGDQERLGEALTLVYTKANSVVEAEVEAPSWLHKFIIGKKGANIREITHDLPKVHVQFWENKITVEGPREEVDRARQLLEEQKHQLTSRLTFEEIRVDPKYHKHIIGKSGVNVNRIKEETGVLINIPSDAENSHIIRIEGTREGVAKAKEELTDMVKKMENERSRDIHIESRFHRTIIGAKGEKIKEIKDKFNQVNVTFPEPGMKSDVVTIRGPQQDVESCYRHLFQLNKEMVETNFRIEVPIYKQFHKYIIGKEGAKIKKIRDETDTKIDLPAEGSDSDVIVITGKKQNVETARDKITAIQNEQASIVVVDIIIPAKFHNSMIGAGGRLIRSIMEECGGVSIRFPAEKSGSDKVTIRGPKEDVDKAKKQLLELTNEKQLTSYTVEIRAKPEDHKFLIGKNGAKIRKVKENTGARIIFPSDTDEDRELILIVGRKEDVEAAKLELEASIKLLENVVESTMQVDPKYHRHFVARRGQVLRDIGEEYGGVTVSFPRSGVDSDKVMLKGAKDCVEGAKQRILEIVTELEQMVNIECVIAQKHHRTVMGAKGFKVQDITQRFNVQVKFPEREPLNNHQVNGDGVQENGESVIQDGTQEDGPKPCDIIKIRGKKENCQQAKEALLALVPITVEVQVPFDFHGLIIGQKGRDVRIMMENYDVNIAVPPVSERSDIIRISGPPANVEQAKAALEERVDGLEKDKQNRVLRNFKLELEVDPKHHPKIIGRRGMVISKIRIDHEVQIQFPAKDADNQGIIQIIGYEHNALAAKDAILKIVTDLDDMVSEEVKISSRVHSRIIGTKGRNIRRIMDQYKVDIRFPRDGDENPDLVVISGMEDHVWDCKDYLLNLEEEYLQDLTDDDLVRQYTQAPSRQQGPPGSTQNDAKGFVVKGAPWDQSAPDTSSASEFPSFGSGPGGDAPSKPMYWGPRR